MRRALVLPFLLAGLPALADDIPVPSRVETVTVFPSGASLTRSARFSAPAGQHQLILSDMPVRDIGGLRIEAEGVTLGTVTIRNDLTPPRAPEDIAAIKAAQAEVARAEEALATARDAIRAIQAEAQAARARIAFLNGLAKSDGLAAEGIEALRAISRMVGEETLDAEQVALAAEARVRNAERDLKDLIEALARAQQALAALDTEKHNRAYLAVSIDAPGAVEGELTIRYLTGAAGWRPVYDFHLDRAEWSMDIGRGAYVSQWTGENWDEVTMELSTVRPSGQTEPGTLYPVRRWIEDPRKREDDARYAAAAPKDEERAGAPPEPVMEVRADARYDGLSVTYSYPSAVSIATDADELRLALGTLSVTPEIGARAVPLRDETAFLMATFTNGAEEILLPTDASEFYLDGTFVGLRQTGIIAAGDEASFSFGPIEGIRLSRIVLDRTEGGRGVISKSNEQVEEVRIEIRNLTGEAWPLRLIDQVPYSEQEDLEIEWSATPAPSDTNMDGERGILAWDMDLAPGATKAIRLTQTLTWPAEKVLR